MATCISQLGELWLEQGNAAGAAREFAAELAHKPIDPAQAHFDLARALNAEHDTEKAKDRTFSGAGDRARIPSRAEVVARVERRG